MKKKITLNYPRFAAMGIFPRDSGSHDKEPSEFESLKHWLGAYKTNALYSGHIFVRFNDLEDVFT